MKHIHYLALTASLLINNMAFAEQNNKAAMPTFGPTPQLAPPPAPINYSSTAKASAYENYTYFKQDTPNQSSDSDTIWKKKNSSSAGSFGNNNWSLNTNDSLAKSQWEFQLFLVRQELANMRTSYGSGITSQFGMVNNKNMFGSTYTSPEQTQLNNQRYARLIEDERFILDRLAGIPVVSPRTQSGNTSTSGTENSLQNWVDSTRAK